MRRRASVWLYITRPPPASAVRTVIAYPVTERRASAASAITTRRATKFEWDGGGASCSGRGADARDGVRRGSVESDRGGESQVQRTNDLSHSSLGVPGASLNSPDDVRVWHEETLMRGVR